MKKIDLKEIERLHEEAVTALTLLVEIFSEEHDELQEKFNGKSEKWQESEKGQEASEKISSMESLLDEFQGALDAIQCAAIPTGDE